MTKMNVASTICFVFVAAIASIAWSQGRPIGVPQSGGSYYQPSQPAPPPGMSQGQPAWTPPAPAYQSPQAVPNQQQAGQAYPSYPYPPHHNPYYDGVPHANFLSPWFDYIFNLPSAVIGRVADIMDRTIFPASPATHGKPGGTPVPEAAAPPAPQNPLPPASLYDPTRR
ncbi:MAG: hypothetical protein LDL33_11450 [Desulfomonile sp.]|nr:hypothetical protein [Desulfomonile sp.]